MAKYGRYEQVHDGQWFTWDWRNNRTMCCDCGLVHRTNYRLTLDSRHRIRLQEQPFRDTRATARARKTNKRKQRKYARKCLKGFNQRS
jgi:hypothetical protein